MVSPRTIREIVETAQWHFLANSGSFNFDARIEMKSKSFDQTLLIPFHLLSLKLKPV
jgi:hypothetical protein